ncbi:MAG: NIPSNAP family protein [Betaproteobacteria bacterium]|nr:NIPSNAP family protein [Betaproteobacteria bacterium]
MIYEMRTYDLKPRALPEVEKRFGEAYEYRKKYSPLAAFWHTEIGPLNQVVHVWPYQDLEERAKIRAAAVKDGNWPPKIAEFIVTQRSDIMIPFTISPEIKPGKMGPYFEMRTYTYLPGELPVIMKNWEAAIQVRLQFGPVCAIWYSELGGLNKFVHIWPYPTLDARVETRKKAMATGVWPPGTKAEKEGGRGYQLFAQENKILMPAAFSPLQ